MTAPELRTTTSAWAMEVPSREASPQVSPLKEHVTERQVQHHGQQCNWLQQLVVMLAAPHGGFLCFPNGKESFIP